MWWQKWKKIILLQHNVPSPFLLKISVNLFQTNFWQRTVNLEQQKRHCSVVMWNSVICQASSVQLDATDGVQPVRNEAGSKICSNLFQKIPLSKELFFRYLFLTHFSKRVQPYSSINKNLEPWLNMGKENTL